MSELAGRPPGRSWIDPITNITLLAPVQLEDHAGALVARRLPSVALPAYLHEATHHLCFFSPVGLALTLLSFRARRRALRLELAGPRRLGDAAALSTIDVLDDFVRFDAMARAQTPLAEGLAAFAEFDALPGTSSVATTVMLSLAGFFSSREEPDADVFAALVSSLHAERTGFRYGGRKASLLLQGMDLRHGGYLAGYLMVKRMWRDAARVNRRLDDSDLFLNLLVTYVYWDFGLVAHLLDPGTSDIGAVPRIVNYFGGRLEAFQSGLCDDWLDAVEANGTEPFRDDELTGGLDEALGHSVDLGGDPGLCVEGRERLVAMHRELERDAEGGEELVEDLAHEQRWALASRELLCVGRLDVALDISDLGWVRVWRGDRLVSAGPAEGDAPAMDRTAGSLEIFLNPWAWGRYMAYAASVGGTPVVTWFSRKLPPVLREQFLGYQTDTAAAAEREREIAAALEHQLHEDGVAEVVIPALRENLAAWARQAYASSALPALDAAGLDLAVARMAEDGLRPVLGSLANVRALAWLSLNWPFHGDDLAQAFREAEIFHGAAADVWAVAAEIAARAEAALGEPLVHVADGRLFTTV